GPVGPGLLLGPVRGSRRHPPRDQPRARQGQPRSQHPAASAPTRSAMIDRSLASEPRPAPEPPRAPRSSASARRSARARLQELLAPADVILDGTRPWDPKIRDERFLDVAFAGSLPIGEAYMDGLWECDQLDELVCRFRRARLDERFRIGSDAWRVVKARLYNFQSAPRSADMGRRVYDGATDLFEATLDPRMVYSCAYWRDARTLDEAQEAKL